MARGIFSIVATAVVAGAIGFGAGVYLVPNEKADQFRAMVQGGLGAIYRVVDSDKANSDFLPSESSQTKPHAETSRKEAQPDVPAGSQPGANAKCDPGDSACSGGLPVDAAAPQGVPDRDVASPSTSSSEPNDDQTSPAFDTVPSETLPPNSSPNIESEAPAPVAPETLGAKKVKPESNPEN